jgi:ASC-1-like (ASCH) protein
MVTKKCLSLKQPYAELVVSGKKTIELRKWNTKFRGEFLIHASKKLNMEACKRNKINPKLLTIGAIIGKAALYDVKVYDNESSLLRDKGKHFATNESANNKYGFLLKDGRKFRRPYFVRGKLRFFDVDLE